MNSTSTKWVGPVIPVLSAGELERRRERVRFVGAYYRSGSSGPTNLYYLEKRPSHWGFWLIASEEKADDLELLLTITTYHEVRRDDEGFEPTVGEYLSQIPASFVDRVAAVEHNGRDAKKKGSFWRTTTRLYQKKP